METTKNILEIIYFISGPVLAFFAFMALRQISETKKSRIISSKREAYKIAADKCEFFSLHIIPLINNLDDVVRERGITLFKKLKIEITSDKIHVEKFLKDNEETDKIFSIIPQFLDLANQLDSISLFFVSGIADENIGYLGIGEIYCETVKKYTPLIVLFTREVPQDSNSLIDLFTIWNARLEKDRLEKEKKIIDIQLRDIKESSIKTIGTE